ncbi:MAG: hypothetical protein WCW66_06260 [Patescibacteria group bacterium]
MFGKKPSPNFHGETDVAPVPEVPSITAQDLRTGFSPAPMPKNKLMISIAIGIAVFVIAIGGVVYANYEGYLDISFLPSKKDKIISEMMGAMQTVKKAKYNIAIATKTEPWDGVHQPVVDINNSNLPIDQSMISGVLKDAQLQLNVESYFDLDMMSKDIKAMNGYVKMSGIYGQGNNQMALGLELRKVGEDVYGMLSDYPALIATFVPQISELKNKWIKVSGDDEYGKYLDMAYESQDTIDEMYSTDNYGFAFDTGFIKLGKKLPSEVLDGQATMHYQMVMDMDNFEPMYAQLMAKTYELQNVLSEDQFANLNLNSVDDLSKLELGEPITPDMIKAMETLIDNMDIEIWVGEDDNVVRRIKATMYTVLPETQRTAEVGQTKVEMLMNLSNVNQPMEITAPESAMTITEVVGMFAPKDTDEDGLVDADEANYGTDINNPDSDGDSYLDGSEVDGGYNPLGEGKLPVSIDLDTTSMYEEETSETCAANGGEWIVAEKAGAEECAAITDWIDCEEMTGCMWDSLSDSEIDCVPKADYCACADGSTYFFGCDKNGFLNL